MADRLGDINARIEANVLKALKYGPRLRGDYNVVVLARDRKAQKALLAGLGALGVGMQWADVDTADLLFGYDDAPEQKWTPDN